jgi:hypothetical protein
MERISTGIILANRIHDMWVENSHAVTVQTVVNVLTDYSCNLEGLAIHQYDGDAWLYVKKSRFYTYAMRDETVRDLSIRDLTAPCRETEGAKTYCPPPDWWQDGSCPYPVWRVCDDVLVYSPEQGEM